MLTKLLCSVTAEKCQGLIEMNEYWSFFNIIDPLQLFITPQGVTAAAVSP